MKSTLIVICLLFSVVVSDRALFSQFKSKYNKSYDSTEEHEKRFKIFTNNLVIADRLNKQYARTTYGVTKFMDMTTDEFKAKHLMKNVEFPSAPVAQITNKNLPDSFDWNSKGKVTPVQNEGSCGSSLFSSIVETVESAWAIAGHPLVPLSVQQVVDCDALDSGCDGGFINTTYYYIEKSGLMSAKDYPYSGGQGQCKYDKKEVVATISSWEFVTQDNDEVAIQNYIYQKSPVAACADAITWQYYTGGVITANSTCSADDIDHCVQITGWDQVSGVAAWHVRNVWGVDWGVNGYVYIEMGHNVCGIAEDVTAPII